MKLQFRSLPIRFVSLLTLIPATSYARSQAPTAVQPTNTDTAVHSSTGQSRPVTEPTAMKVWTNDDIDRMPYTHSAAGNGKSELKKASAASRPYSQEKDPGWYRKQLAPPNAEIERLDPQIAKLKAFLSGENVSDPPTMHRQLVPTPKDQLQQMEVKRQADAAKIEDLLDRARHNGIEPGQLR